MYSFERSYSYNIPTVNFETKLSVLNLWPVEQLRVFGSSLSVYLGRESRRSAVGWEFTRVWKGTKFLKKRTDEVFWGLKRLVGYRVPVGHSKTQT